VADTIVLTLPARARFRAVATLVLGGVGSRLDLPYERMDDLQLAVMSALGAGADDPVTLEVEAEDGSLSVSLGPLEDGSGADPALARVLEPLVDSFESRQRDGREWLTLRLARSRT
jgi:hypothetical protein